MLQLHDIFKLQCVKLMYKKNHQKLHKYHTSKLLAKYEVTEINTRRENDVYVNEPENTLTTANSINLKVGKYWNGLSSEIKDNAFKTSIATFVNHVKNEYFSRYSDTCIKDSCYVCENK